ncbi:MAG: deoxyhypusine synthase family protein [Gammaproteobacteria bacterium]|nr:deoxyhypusine synthase family protein [Gammaproteobacteria bacterium]
MDQTTHIDVADSSATPEDPAVPDRDSVIDGALAQLKETYERRLKNADRLEHGTAIRGYDHEGPFSLSRFVDSLATTGFQATNLARAIAILREVRDHAVPIYLGFTSNVGTCGLRETITYLTRHRHVRALATTAGAVEEDVMKVFRPFVLGDFRADGRDLYERMINRTGNIFIPTGRYTRLHLLLWTLNRRLARTRPPGDARVGITEYTRELGRQMELMAIPRREESFVYWAYKQDIPLHCPVLLDGAIGDVMYYFRRESRRRFAIDATEYQDLLIDDMILATAEHGAVALVAIGGSVPKHMICNAAIFGGGARYAVYVNNATEGDGSNAGAPIDEAVTWGKIRAGAQSVKVEGEATLVVPLLVAAAFQEYTPVAHDARGETMPETGATPDSGPEKKTTKE